MILFLKRNRCFFTWIWVVAVNESMEKFEISILGCGSALPTARHLPTSQVVNIREKLFMIDCGEGTQLQMRRNKLKFSNLNHIFISHLHGDHCFGLIGLISTMGLLGRMAPLFIHAPAELERLLKPQIDFFCHGIDFKIEFHPIDPTKNAILYKDRSVTVSSIPLKHRMPCCGFLFEETPPMRHIIREMIDFYRVPMAKISAIKEGSDFVTEEGEIVPNERLTRDGGRARRYAYCSDTAYHEAIIPVIEGVDLLFHESTFMETEAKRAEETFHSTVRQAATIAQKAQVKRLIIGHYSSRYEDVVLFEKEAVAIFKNTHAVRENELIRV